MIKNKILDISVFLVIIFLILYPLFFDKLFLMDFIPVVNKNFDLLYGRNTPIYGGVLPFNIISMIIPIDIFQKMIFFMILFFSGFTMYNFVEKMKLTRAASFYSGLLYIVNPYMYIRLAVGHWSPMLSYSITPFLLSAFIDMLDKKGKKEIIKFIFILSIIAFSIHILIITLIIIGIIFIFWYSENKDIRFAKIIILTTILFILANFYWIIPSMTAKETIYIDGKDFDVFAPNIEDTAGLYDVIAMYGFWNEEYLYAKDFISGWQILYLMILSLSIIGFFSYYKDNKIGIYTKSFAVVGIIGFILASGIKGPFPQIYWLFDNTILKGFRDSNKFVAMLVISYSFLGALGLSKLKEMKDTQINIR